MESAISASIDQLPTPKLRQLYKMTNYLQVLTQDGDTGTPAEKSVIETLRAAINAILVERDETIEH